MTDAFARASHRVMGYVQDGMRLDAAVYKAAMDEGLGLMEFGRLGIEAKREIPKLLASGELKAARDAYRENTEDKKHLPLKHKLDVATGLFHELRKALK